MLHDEKVARLAVGFGCQWLHIADFDTLDEKSPKRIFEGNALLRRCVRLGLLEEDKRELDYVLAIKVSDIMARRLQTLVFKQNLAKSLHHARVLIRQRHVRYV